MLDNGVFLTAVEVGQMQQVPELVFLNCCHIGQTGPEAPGLGGPPRTWSSIVLQRACPAN